ncbi:MAG: hypothetical protein GOVbin1807_107 [Prokaryotic dsDNA virus sp.]|nr:MAG: hypothetical protein GOVbin1807_107 [Prokaryotic dsDNA virus sp.]|tara:strand:+ start:2485 stop:2856 length:372 start_codon:yes stop_codon:yes gene_type:complete
MKITNEQLRQIIKEELENVLNETIPTDPGLESMPRSFWTAMSDHTDKWLKQSGQKLATDNQFWIYFNNLRGKLKAVIADDSEVNIKNANTAMIPLSTYYPEVAQEFISGAEQTNSGLTFGKNP